MGADDVIAVIKITGALVGGALGVLGLFFNFRRPNNRISGLGAVVLAGIVVSAVVGVVGSIVEAHKAKLQATQQAARTERLLRELSRAIQPITQLEMTYWVYLPSNAPQVRGYLADVSRGIEARIESLRREVFFKPDDGGIHITASGLGNEPLSIKIGHKSALWPRGKDADIAALVGSFTFNVFIRKTPIAEENFEPVIAADGRYADWIAITFLPARSDLVFDRRRGRLEIFGSSEYRKPLWHSNGKITSIIDLYGSQLLLVSPLGTQQLPERFKKYARPRLPELSRLVDVKTIVLSFSEGRDMWIDGGAFKKVASRFGNSVFSIILPSDDEGFRRITPKE